MHNGITLGPRIIPALAAIAICASLATIPEWAKASGGSERSTVVQLAQYGCQMFGPFATMRRANEVANGARSYGYSAISFHNGNGYYVKVC